MLKVYIATTNQGKLHDFAVAAAGKVEVAPLPGMAQLPPPEEDGQTFEENARKKAEYYSRLAPGELVLADDSGLEVEALSGAPGIRSARYAGADDNNSSDEANNARLLQELENVPDAQRRARFVCALATARNGTTVLAVQAEVEGWILRQPRGSKGFGYDPLFFFPGLGKSAAELTPEEKAEVSHRGRAFRSFLEKVGQISHAGSRD